jgi:hypothetical protein
MEPITSRTGVRLPIRAIISSSLMYLTVLRGVSTPTPCDGRFQQGTFENEASGFVL